MKQQKFEKAFRQAVNKVITDDSRESELLKQKKIIAGCKNKLAASGMLLYYFKPLAMARLPRTCCNSRLESEFKAKRISEAGQSVRKQI